MTANRFATARMRNLAHSALLLAGMTALLCLLGWTLAGPEGVLWAFVLGAVVLTVSPRLSPGLTLRLYGARPLAPGQAPTLERAVAELARRAGLPRPPVLHLVPSPVPNAFAVGARDNAALAVTAGLLQTLSLRETACVLAHEIGHIDHNDMRVMGLSDVISRITSFFSLFGQILVLVNLPLVLTGHVTVPWNAVLVLLAAPYLALLMQRALSRARELDADLEGARLSGDPAGLASALGRIELQQGGWFSRLFLPGRYNPHPSPLRSHPLTEERIARLRQLATEPQVFPPIHTLFPEPSPPFAMARRVPVRPRWRIGGYWY
ncbi:MAG: M48 family metalloprotease [Desulfovibrionaceae bacterium]|jgi:heat shock protein HtpX|nr:M48 family metalloprotease [Desulfovibrionaceae bacterium]